MIKICIAEILEKRNKSKYWLSKQLGADYREITKLVNGTAKTIRLSRLEEICEVLNVDLGDILVRTADDNTINTKNLKKKNDFIN